MKESEFYQRALRDTAFRREKLEESIYAKRVGVVVLSFLFSVAAALSLYGAYRNGQWDAGFGCFALCAIGACSYSNTVTRLAALEAMEEEPNQTPEPKAAAGRGSS